MSSRQFVVAVRLDLDTPGFTYTKWGDTQTCKRGDWLVNNNRRCLQHRSRHVLANVCIDGPWDAYAVAKDAFERMYELS